MGPSYSKLIPSVYDPVTYAMAFYLDQEDKDKEGDYVAFATRRAPDNAASYYPGRGHSKAAALYAARYWSNQAPYIRVVPANKAPKWALETARTC